MKYIMTIAAALCAPMMANAASLYATVDLSAAQGDGQVGILHDGTGDRAGFSVDADGYGLWHWSFGRRPGSGKETTNQIVYVDFAPGDYEVLGVDGAWERWGNNNFRLANCSSPSTGSGCTRQYEFSWTYFSTDGKNGLTEWATAGDEVRINKPAPNAAEFYNTPADAVAGITNPMETWSFAEATRLGFYLSDNFLRDNSGAISLEIYQQTPPVSDVPLPASGLMLSAAALGMAGLRRKR